MHHDEQALIDALKPILARHFPIVGELCRIDLADATACELEPRGRCDGPLCWTPWYVSLCVKTSAFDKRDTEGGLAICNRGQFSDPRVAPCLEGQLMALTTVTKAATRRVVQQHWAVGYLHTGLPLTVLSEGATKDDYCRYFLTYPWLGRYLPGRPARAPWYVRAPADEYVRDGTLDVQSLWTWIGRQVPRTFEDPAWDDAMIEALPDPVRVLEAVLMMHAMVGGGGFEVWLGQARGADIRRGHEALGVIGATKLQALMSGGIALAIHEGAEFCHDPEVAWARTIKARRPRDWRAIDGHQPDRTYALLESEMFPLAQTYAQAHHGALVGRSGETGTSPTGPRIRRGTRRPPA